MREYKLLNNLTKGILLFPFLLVISTVFIVGKDLANGIVSGKYFWFYGSMGLVVLSTFITSVFFKNRFRFSSIDVLVLLFAGSIYVSALINNMSLNLTKLTLLTLLIVLYFCVRIFLNDYKCKTFNQNLICIFMIVTALVESVWGLLQLYGFENSQHSLFKVTGSFFNPGPYAGYLAVIFPMALYYWLYDSGKAPSKRKTGKYYLHLSIKWFSGITCIAIILILPATMSRASWLALSGGALIVLGIFIKENFPAGEYYNRYKKIIHATIAIIFILVLIAFAGIYLLKKDSADGRILLWKVSLQQVSKYPWGVGLGNFPGFYGNAQAEYMISGKATEAEKYITSNPEYAFNEYLQIMVESGIGGIIFFLLLIVLTIRSLYREKKWGILGSFISLLIFAFFSYPFNVLPFLILFIFFIAMNGGLAGQCFNRFAMIVFNLILIAATTLCLYKQYPVYKAYKLWNTERIFYTTGLYKEAFETYHKLYPYLRDDLKFLFEYAQSLSKLEQYQQSNKVLSRAMEISCDPMLYNLKGRNHQALKEYEAAEYNFIRSLQMVPNRLYPYYLLAKLYNEMGLKDKACEMAMIVQVKEPKVMSAAVKEMRQEMEKLDCK